MIRCQIHHLAERCRQRGYSIEDVKGCIVEDYGNGSILVDPAHPKYPKAKSGRPFVPRGGPGTELKQLLKRIGITASPDCSCNARARLMDENEAREPGWVEANLDTVVGWLREEASKRGLPFVDMAGRMLVKRAIKNAKKATLE